METAETDSRPFLGALWAQIERGGDYLPNLVAAILVLVLGWVIARLVRSGVQRLAISSNHLLSRAFPRGVLAGTRVSTGVASLLGELVFWVVLLVTVTVAARMAGLNAITGWLDRITAHLPNLIAGSAIFIIGYFLSVYVREQLAPRSAVDTSRQQLLLGRTAQTLVVAIALIVGLDQVGIDVAVLVGLAVAAAAAVGIGVAVAFALGAREHVSNLIGARVARQQLSEGLRVRIGDVEGEVLEITTSQIALDTDAGKTLLPASCLDQCEVTILAPNGPARRIDV